MDYFDDHHKEPEKPKRASWLLPAILGGIIGAGIVLLVAYGLDRDSLTPNDQSQSQQGEATQLASDSNQNPNLQNVSVDVQSGITDIVDKTAPAVVGVVNLQQGDALFSQEESTAGSGSGVIYKQEGDKAYVVTNHHVVEGATDVDVILHNGVEVSAKLLGSDVFTDLAVLEMDASRVEQVIEVGTSSTVKTGEPVIAIGDPLGFSGSVTQGIISGVNRTVPQDFNGDGRADWQADVMQTDAAINPGNSGGALINMAGQLIGINSMKIAESSVEGIGFAIPVDSAVPIMEQLEQNGQVERPYLGVEAYSLNEIPASERTEHLGLPNDMENGVYIWSLEALSPAENAGLRELDVITELDGQPIDDMTSLRKHLYEDKHIGDQMKVTYYRDGEKNETTVTLSEQQ
ncbi:S1C family serine protease [Terribacillus saccharophilus]|uniref:Serine protease Do n=1 Tax=Terribacillus saccharophilus TaxID=361277 RepID=A0AAX2EJ91_9BACI|nr:S1C family serine protease [Terribacillus goriensis]MEC0284411.1 S1C family serine protease [Terribacillus saccharophilus]MEC0291089.1 S1C family serine protease [Terribacillus saccharophilus]SEN99912.1 serine protease Do [Terribacillus saccharophilus]